MALPEVQKSVYPVEIPFAFHAPPAAKSLVKYNFVKPSKIAVIGSFLLETMAKHPEDSGAIDVALEIPSECFQEKDLINHRYFHKRAYYLAVVAQSIQKAFGTQYELEFVNFQNDEKRPILVVKSTSESEFHYSQKRGISIRFFPHVAANYFPRAKLAPSRNCVRPNQGPDSFGSPPTPQYNASLLHELYMPDHVNLLFAHSQEAPAFKDCILLIKVWLAQRGLDGHTKHGHCFNGFLASMILGWLIRVKSSSFKKVIFLMILFLDWKII